jgi:serine/threonine-protein kinase
MKKIKLPNGEWFYDPKKPLGPEGGFGIVYEGKTATNQPLAVKRLKIEANEAAHRELRIAQELGRQDFKNVIPCFDAGQDAESDYYFVVMAKAEKSLQDEIDSGKKYSVEETANVMLQIVKGLLEVPDIVHRDLKPGNVLLHEGQWKIADFGIARFIEESTSLKTLKGCLSPPYAAPEQWRFEKASQATDAYALGCIGYCLLIGTPPFAGPQTEDYQRQHLSVEPPKLDSHPPFLRSLVSMLLRKSPEARPSHKRIQKLIAEGWESSKDSRLEFDALAAISAQLAEQHAREEAERETLRIKQEKRDRLATEAVQHLQAIYDELLLRISRAAPSAVQSGNRIALGKGLLDLAIANNSVPVSVFKRSGWDVVAEAKIFVRQSDNDHVISSSLFYAKRRGEGEYRWWEIGFNFSSFSDKRYLYHVSLNAAEHADIALTQQTIGQFTVQYGPKPIDDEDSDAFSLKWANLLAKASSGEL